MPTVGLERFTVKSGMESRAKEWMGVLNDRIDECRATLGGERMYFEAIFSEEQGGRMYLY